MKKLILFLVLLISLLAVNVNGQDTLYLKNHKMFDVKILENTNKLIDYCFSDYPDGPVFSVKPIKIFKIVYKNGYTEDFGTKNPRVNRPFGISTGLCLAATYPGNLGYARGMFL